MSRFHRLQTQTQLHRPERAGSGDPNTLSLSDVLDGQYYQDTDTGSIYRYSESLSTWELIIQYDRTTGRIANVGQATFTRTNKIGSITSAITSSSVSSINARLLVGLIEGEDIRIVSDADDTKTISLTVTADTSSGDVVVPVQTTQTAITFPAGSLILAEDGLRNAYTTVDPNKLQSKIDVEHAATSIGELQTSILASSSSVSSIDLTRVDPDVIIGDGKKLLLVNEDGDSQVVTTNGAQTLTNQQGQVSVDAFDPVYDFPAGRSFLYEPSYASTSRITLTENSIVLQASQISDLSNSTASLNISVAENAANIALLSSVTDGINSSVSTLQANASAQQATLDILTAFQSDTTNAIVAINANANEQQATLDLLTAFEADTTNALVAINTNASAQQASLDLLAQFEDDTNNALAAINLFADNLQSSVNTSVQYNNVGAYFELIAGNTGSVITLAADQIDINGVVTFINSGNTTTIDGDSITTGTITASQINVADLFSQTIEVGNVIKSNNYATGTTGFAVFANGTAEFSNATIRGAIIAGSGSSIEGLYVSNLNASTITTGSIDANVITVTNLDADQITSGSIDANVITVSNLDADQITSGSIDANIITVSNLNASSITTGAIDASVINVTNLNASQITTGTIDADRINVADVFAQNIDVDGTISGNYSGLPSPSGWRIQGNGDAEFNNVVVRGVGRNFVLELYESSVIKTSANALSGDAGVLIFEDGIFAGTAGQDETNANVRISNSGSAYFSGAIVAGSGSSIEGLYVSNLNASDIVSGSIDANVITVSNLDADQITSGSIDASDIAVTNINASQITVGTLSADRIAASSIEASKLNVDAISSISANIGSINAGVLSGSNLTINLDAGTLDADSFDLEAGRLSINSVNTAIPSAQTESTASNTFPNVVFTGTTVEIDSQAGTAGQYLKWKFNYDTQFFPPFNASIIIEVEGQRIDDNTWESTTDVDIDIRYVIVNNTAGTMTASQLSDATSTKIGISGSGSNNYEGTLAFYAYVINTDTYDNFRIKLTDTSTASQTLVNTRRFANYYNTVEMNQSGFFIRYSDTLINRNGIFYQDKSLLVT